MHRPQHYAAAGGALGNQQVDTEISLQSPCCPHLISPSSFVTLEMREEKQEH